APAARPCRARRTPPPGHPPRSRQPRDPDRDAAPSSRRECGGRRVRRRGRKLSASRRLQGYEATRLQGYKATGLRGNKATRPRGCKAARDIDTTRIKTYTRYVIWLSVRNCF